MYVCDVCVCMHVCMYVRMYVCMHACMDVYMYTCVYVCMYVTMKVCSSEYLNVNNVCVCLSYKERYMVFRALPSGYTWFPPGTLLESPA